ARAGCAGVLMLPPFYYKGVTEEGLFRSFAQAIDRAAEPRLRVYLYHIPQVSQVGIPLAVIARLVRAYPGVVIGMKDSSGAFEQLPLIAALKEAVARRTGDASWRTVRPPLVELTVEQRARLQQGALSA